MSREAYYLSRRHRPLRWWWEGAIDDLLLIWEVTGA